MFNRLKENKSQKECRDIAANLNNIELLDSWMRVCALGKAQNILMTSKNVIFGGRLAEYKYYDMAPIIEKVIKYYNF